MDTPNLSAGLLGPAPMSSVQTAGGLSSGWGESSVDSVIIHVLGNVLLMFCVCVSQEEEEEVQLCQETTSWAKIRSVYTHRHLHHQSKETRYLQYICCHKRIVMLFIGSFLVFGFSVVF